MFWLYSLEDWELRCQEAGMLVFEGPVGLVGERAARVSAARTSRRGELFQRPMDAITKSYGCISIGGICTVSFQRMYTLG